MTELGMTERALERATRALNYAIGYLDAIAGTATTTAERQSAERAVETIHAYVYTGIRPANESANEAPANEEEA